MATEKQIAANRANAKRSTGPRTAAGKERSSRNAYQHGLSVLEPLDASSFAMLNAIVGALAAELATEEQLIAAKDYARAHVTLAQIQAIRVEQWAKVDLQCVDAGSKDLKRLSSLDRYERYALTKRRRASKKMLLGGYDGKRVRFCQNEPNFRMEYQ